MCDLLCHVVMDCWLKTRTGISWFGRVNRTEAYFNSTHQFRKVLKPSFVGKLMFLCAGCANWCMHSRCTHSFSFTPLGLSFCHELPEAQTVTNDVNPLFQSSVIWFFYLGLQLLFGSFRFIYTGNIATQNLWRASITTEQRILESKK